MRYVGNKGTETLRRDAAQPVAGRTRIPNSLSVQIRQFKGRRALFDRMLMGLNVTGFGVVDGVTRTDSAALRTFTTTRTMWRTGTSARSPTSSIRRMRLPMRMAVSFETSKIA